MVKRVCRERGLRRGEGVGKGEGFVEGDLGKIKGHMCGNEEG